MVNSAASEIVGTGIVTQNNIVFRRHDLGPQEGGGFGRVSSGTL